MVSETGQTIETIETRWGQSIEFMFGTPEAQALVPDPSVWVAYLNVGAARVGHFRPPLGRVEEPVVEVHVNCGVWQTVCPFCPSAQHASRDDHWFYCARCHNEAVGLMLIPVAWPAEEVEVIEGLLLERDHVDLRSWEPEQATADLVVENELIRNTPPPSGVERGFG